MLTNRSPTFRDLCVDREAETSRDAFTPAEVDELPNNLARLSDHGVRQAYRDAYRAYALERKPGAKAIQRLVTAWKILSN
jgi:hypothetical protein